MTSRNAAAHPLIRWARSLGCEVERTRGSHWRVTYDGKFVCIMAGTPSCSRATKNAKADIRRRVRALEEAAVRTDQRTTQST